ncbi:MAG: hypothetical protein IAF38_09460 [Bacteroidia bacterium]|nr:hypothetical protein [Bacteroidia bacterium]
MKVFGFFIDLLNFTFNTQLYKKATCYGVVGFYYFDKKEKDPWKQPYYVLEFVFADSKIPAKLNDLKVRMENPPYLTAKATFANKILCRNNKIIVIICEAESDFSLINRIEKLYSEAK